MNSRQIISAGAIAALMCSAPFALAQSVPAPVVGSTVAPAAPTGAGPVGSNAAPVPPPDQSVILPSASGYVNSAAPTMNRTCEDANTNRPGTATVDNAATPCLRPLSPGDPAASRAEANESK